jgi:rhodanese-related sulfurtransferase
MTALTRPPRLDPAALREWLAQSDAPRVIDVRTPAEFETAHIPGSYNVPLHLLQEHSAEIAGHLDQDVLQFLAAAIGAGLAIAALTNTCAMGMLLAKLPYNRGASGDLDSVVDRLRTGTAR